ncbi:4'-phosphopantetheinyl transferase superfamily protein [Agrococcus sp. HG114]|uniref:4'-phosphopantetheinyl transferase family protein n=1 Tax=Agrococcus sp. HG114 TaxID=2969757 RepID=UPI00215AE711|nr:hypothetical protein [Agrococcus sp. HG114]MCR8671609.1 hypothetical protein [Agrococcus sp. HG114]
MSGQRPATDVAVHWRTLAHADRSLEGVLDAVELERIARLERPADRGRSLVAAATLRTVAAARLGIAPAAVRVDRTCDACGRQHGAPRLLHEDAPWVSVSHSGVLIAVVLAGAPVGIDVQRLADLPEREDGHAWVRAEAVAKAEGVARSAGHPLGRLATYELVAPLAGYAAALALPVASGTPHVTASGP